VTTRLLTLLGGVVAFWLIVGLPARWLGGGDQALLFCGAALLLCLVPSAATLLWAEWTWKNRPQDVLIMALAATGVRMGVVLLGAFLVTQTAEAFRGRLAFWIWVVVGYLFTLGLEMSLVLAGRPAATTAVRRTGGGG
jgi:hypothetical protein